MKEALVHVPSETGFASKPLVMNIPESEDDCNGIQCGKCYILHETLYGERLPRCLYLEKSMNYLKMLGACN